jgi:hypothetical protein
MLSAAACLSVTAGLAVTAFGVFLVRRRLAVVEVAGQVGGALGLAILVTVFGAASRAAARHPAGGLTRLARAHGELVAGMAHAFTLSPIFDVCALLVVLAGLSRQTSAPRGHHAQ